MKVLVLQMRGVEDASRDIERKEYLHYTGLQEDQIDFVDLYETPNYHPEKCLDYDVLFCGGISKDIASELTWPKERFPFINGLYRMFDLAIQHQLPSLLSCGGFVIAAQYLGAEMFYKESGFELGVYRLKKTTAANSDPLLGDSPDLLPMVSGHYKYFKDCPPNTELLLYTDSYAPQVPVHAFRVRNTPFYAFQGHPEISCQELSKRVKPLMYRKHYFPPRPDNSKDQDLGYNVEAYNAFCALEMDTSAAQDLLKRFASLVSEGKFLKSRA